LTAVVEKFQEEKREIEGQLTEEKERSKATDNELKLTANQMQELKKTMEDDIARLNQQIENYKAQLESEAKSKADMEAELLSKTETLNAEIRRLQSEINRIKLTNTEAQKQKFVLSLPFFSIERLFFFFSSPFALSSN
jgi:uncharacterized protein involved in exopolysaccharide biosynthesis